MNSAKRRHQYFRVRKARSTYWGGSEDFQKREKERRLGIIARTPHSCSCSMCGHFRKRYGPTMQERRAILIGEE